MDQMPFELAAPPAEPPSGADRLLWAVARQLADAHTPDAQGWCVVCRPLADWQCAPRRLAVAALVMAAAGLPVPTPPRGPALPADGNGHPLAATVARLTDGRPAVSTFDSGYLAACEDIMDAIIGRGVPA